ncbi:MAG: hypothetical protein HY525_18250 [Betaproteobacteria bacterium]|nr:hypothetical protein [Betaproteobacteria bacterium]
MNYYHLKSILSTGKKPIAIRSSSSSFFVAGKPSKPYIEPTFQKVIFESEKPTIILISAVGATGKTALAEQLSRDAGLPLLDLGKHKPVGDNTLTGLLTHSFDVKDITRVLSGLSSGTYGAIIDGVDEGRSKTTEKGFEAFLDDIADLCKADSVTTFLLLGRTQILDDCWSYLTEKGIPAALITILPFTVAEAKKYIDTFTGVTAANHTPQYVSARDTILEKLGKAFAGPAGQEAVDFLSFIGYPPVLDAIVTLLTEEKNYYKLLQELGASDGRNVEVSLLDRIGQYILLRERELKVVPNIVDPLLENAPDTLRRLVRAKAFSVEEQCIRLVAYCLGRQLTLSSLGEPILDEKYEANLATWMPEHPFITGRQFRNAVFEALVLATVIASGTNENLRLLTEYLASHKNSYHLVYMLDIVLKDHRIAIGALGPLFTAAMEFRSVRSHVELRVDGPDWHSERPEQGSLSEIEIEIGILLGAEKTESQTFAFRADITTDSRLHFGSRLGGAFISVPCSVQLGGAQELELTAPVEINAMSVTFDAKTLILRTMPPKDTKAEVIMTSRQLDCRLETIMTNGVPLVFALENTNGVAYPAIQYTEKTLPPPTDPLLSQKYFRLKRILMEFRSHSRGSLAKYRDKIEHERVVKNETGRSVLKKLVQDEILSLRGNMYYLDPDKLSASIGASWQDLRKGKMPDSLVHYLSTVA